VADDLFASNRDRVKAVCSEIQKRGLKFSWSAFARANTVDREMLRIMRETGCDSISYGVESGNQEMLDRIKKKITLDQVRRAVGLCQEVGLVVHTSFIVGLPGETLKTLQDSRSFGESLYKEYGVYYGFHLLSPFPGTTVREKVADYDLEILTDDWTLYDANHAIVRTSALSAEAIRRFVDDFDAEVDEKWQELVRGYRDGTNAPLDNLRVEGHHRTQLVFQILSQDLLETEGAFSGDARPEETFPLLCRRLEQRTGAVPHLIEQSLGDFFRKGYIKAFPAHEGWQWGWTHNNRQ